MGAAKRFLKAVFTRPQDKPAKRRQRQEDINEIRSLFGAPTRSAPRKRPKQKFVIIGGKAVPLARQPKVKRKTIRPKQDLDFNFGF